MLKRIFKHNFSIGNWPSVGGVPFVVDDSAVAGALAAFASQLFLASMPLLAYLLLQPSLLKKVLSQSAAKKCCLNSITVKLASLQLPVFSPVAASLLLSCLNPAVGVPSVPVASVVPALLLASFVSHQLPDFLLLPMSLQLPMSLLLQAYLLALASLFSLTLLM